MVERMLSGQQGMAPLFEEGFDDRLPGNLRERVLQMEEQMRELRRAIVRRVARSLVTPARPAKR